MNETKHIIRPTVFIFLVTTIGLVVAFQGWNSRTLSFDFLPYIDEAREFISLGKIPEKGTLTSFGSYTPPGVVWLMVPGTYWLNDPRLFELIGCALLYVGTLVGIFLLARAYFGTNCAYLAVGLWGLSELGLFFAQSSHARGHPFFYVWMVYWTVQWVRQRSANYLAAAVITWSSGMYVFMEIAPALFILPVVWFLYRPPVKLWPLIVAGIVILAIWYPYLRFEYGRHFVDVRSQVLRERILPAGYQESWCEPGLILVNLDDASSTPNFKPDQTLNVRENMRTKLVRGLDSLWGRANLVAVGLQSNFEQDGSYSNLDQVALIPGSSFILMLLVFISLFALSISTTSTLAADMIDRRLLWHKWLKRFAVGMILTGVMANELIIARYLSLDGVLETSTISSIRWLQAVLVGSGIILLVLRRRIVAIVNRLMISRRVSNQTAQHSVSVRLLVLSLLIPWAILLLLVEPNKTERLLWLWPLQVVFLAASVTYLPTQLRAPGWVARIGSIVLLVVLVANPLLLSRVEAWLSTGWSGPDAEEVRLIDYISAQVHSEGRNRAAIGYQTFIYAFMATFNVMNPRYKVGATFDLLFKSRNGVSNTNQCAEGISPDDEYRIVQIKPPETKEDARRYFKLSLGPNFYLLQQFGSYQVFKRG